MDDYSISSLGESKNEWCARLVNILTAPVIEGVRSIFNEANELCIESDEVEKYLMTFQTFLSRIPQWNETMIEEETKRIEDTSNCGYLEDLVTCVHVIQLKALTCVRVGQKQKKVDIDIPSKNAFIHNVYKKVARQLYTSVYLFESGLPPLDIQKHNRELEHLVKECILNTVRDTMPVDAILRAYMDEVDEEVVEVEDEERVALPKPTLKPSVHVPVSTPVNTPVITPSVANVPTIAPLSLNPTTEVLPVSVAPPVSAAPVAVPPVVAPPVVAPPVVAPPVITPPASVPTPVISLNTNPPPRISFTDTDKAMDTTGKESMIQAPKNIEHLEKLSEARREEEDDGEKLKIGGNVSLDIADISDIVEVL